MIFFRTSLLSKLDPDPVQYREYDINPFLMIFTRLSRQGWITSAHVRDFMARAGANSLGTITDLHISVYHEFITRAITFQPLSRGMLKYSELALQ